MSTSSRRTDARGGQGARDDERDRGETNASAAPKPRRGRPSHATVAERRRRAVRLLAELALEKDRSVRLLARRLEVGVGAARRYLEDLARDPSVGFAPSVADEIRGELARATSDEAVFALERRLLLELAAGRIEIAEARRLGVDCRRLRRQLALTEAPSKKGSVDGSEEE